MRGRFPLVHRVALRLAAVALVCLPCMAQVDEAPATPQLEEKPAAEKVELPGITIDAKNKRIDVAAKIALDEGLLELIACIADTKEHESLVIIDAAPVHIHAALLLIGANNGHPAKVVPANEEQTEWVHLPPRGDKIAVSLVYPDPEDEKKTIERPISDFLKRAERHAAFEQDEQEKLDDAAKVFESFLFAGSIVVDQKEGERRYLADENGNIISISTFGDEVLCLPSRVSQENSALVWAVNNKHLPKVGTKVSLRLSLKDKPDKEEQE